MVQYRKNKHGREFFKIDGDLIVKVLNKERFSGVEVVDNWLSKELATDPYYTVDCTEEEFTSAYKEAFDRIALMKIV
jgi:hypothetical protein